MLLLLPLLEKGEGLLHLLLVVALVEDPPDFVVTIHDRWVGSLLISLPGSYDYASRLSLDGGYTWLYCDLDGSNNGYSAEEAGTVNVQ